MSERRQRIAVILFNLGGPDSLQAVRPFLFNLFNDPAIIGLPNPWRWLLAQLISRRREKTAQAIYQQMGGRSPILDLTREQATALQADLTRDFDVRVFPCTRYWHPRATEVLENVDRFDPETVVLLPLYPQFSTTTTGSSFREWLALEKDRRWKSLKVISYHDDEGFIACHRKMIDASLRDLSPGSFRLLFSAHGLPEKIVAAGDPYQRQIEECAAAIAAGLTNLDDWRVCYQSRVGPLKWIGPSTEEEIRRAGEEGKDIVVVPIAFVSEHSETLVELDIEYREIAEAAGVGRYIRIPALGSRPCFIAALAALARRAIAAGQDIGTDDAIMEIR